MEVSNVTILAFILGVIGMIALPFGGIWALNTLFTTGLEYNFTTWAAVLFAQLYLQIVIKSGTARSTKKSKAAE